MRRLVASLLAVLLVAPGVMRADIEEVQVPVDTRVYVTLTEEVIGKKKLTQVGQIVGAKVWRDVVVDGRIVIHAGEPVLVKVDELKSAKVAGIRGSMSLGAYEASTVDGERIQLSGGYMKKGKGRIALSASLAGLVFLPLIFIKGKAATLPEGTVFDAYTDEDRRVSVQPEATPKSINLAGLLSDLKVRVLYDELETQEKPKLFDFEIVVPLEGEPTEFIIDRINGEPTEPIPLKIVSRGELDEKAVLRAQVDIKTLAKRFAKGINRFDVACDMGGERVATEVVLDIQF